MSLTGRAIVLMLATLFMFGGPFDRQVLHNDHRIFKFWKPYSGPWPGVCVARFALHEPGRPPAPVSRLEVLYGVPHWWDVPRHQRALSSPREVWATGRAMCDKLGVVDLRTHAKCSTNDGYRIIASSEKNLCARQR